MYTPQRQIVARKKPTHEESKIQIASVRWFDYKYPEFSDLLHSIPNEGKRTNGGRMVAMGLRKGCLDMKLAVPRGGYHGLYIEMKAPGKKLSKEQEAFAKKVIEQGYAVAVCRSVDEFVIDVTEYMTGNDRPLRLLV